MENSVHFMHGAEVPCLLDTSSEIDRNDLMIDIMRLPMMQFQALCCGIRSNMSTDELAKMVSSWTEERVRKNILQTMAELEGRTNILSSSYHDRMLHKDNQDKRMEMTKDAPEVQLAPVTKEVFVTVLDSIKSPSSAEITSGSKLNFITYVHGMVDKVKDFPKLFKASHKQSKELNITPAVCESLSELLAFPDLEKRSTTSLHDSTERLCTEDEISRASRGVSSILLIPGGSSSQQVVTEIQQPQSSATSLASARSVHDNARGIVDTIVTDLEDLYESLEPKEVEMIQSQSSLTQIEHAMDDDETQKKFHNKVAQIMCSAQVKLRMFFTMHRSEDIIPDLKTDLATEETDHDGIQPENSCEVPNQSDAEGLADVLPHEDLILSFADEQMHATDECASVSDGNDLSELTNESQVQALTSTEQQATIEMLDLEACDKSFPCEKDGDVPIPASQHEPKDKKPRTRKGLKIFFPKNNIPKMTPDNATEPQVLVDTSIPETVLYTTESKLETMSTFPIASPETATVEVIQDCVTPSQAAPQCMDICEDNETTLASSDQDEGIEAPIIIVSSDRKDNTLILEVVAVSDDKTSEPVEPMEQGEKFNLFSHRADTKPTSDSIDFDNTVNAFIEKSLSPESFTKEDPDEMTDVVSSGNQHTMGGKFRILFSKRPAVKTPEPQETTQDKLSSLEERAVETHAPDMESFTCKPFESTLPEVSPSDDIGEGDGTSITDMTQDIELSLTPTTPETKGNRQSVGRRFKTLFIRSPKPIDVEPPTQADESVLEVAPILGSEMTDDTPDNSHALDTEATLQPPMTTSFKTSLQDVAVTPETKYNHLSVGKKMKTLFSKSPKPIDVEPAMQTDEAITELPLSLDFEMRDQTSVDSCASDAEATLEPPTQTSDETSLQRAPAKVIPGSKDNFFSVGKKMKTLFTKSPKPIDAEPSIQGDEAVPEVAPSTDSETKDESPFDSSAPDAEATLQPPMQTFDETSLHAPAKAIPESKDNRFSLGKKMKTMFTKSPNPIAVGPPLQTNEAISEIALSPDSEITVEIHDTKATIQQEFLTTPSDKMEAMIESTECSHAVLRTVAETSQSPVMGHSQEMAQGSPVFESSTSLTATERGKVDDNSRSLSTKFKQLFVKHLKNTHDVPAVPAVLQEVAKECVNDNILPETVSQTCEAAVQQSVNMSFQETPRREDNFETNGTVSPPVSQKGPTPNMTGPISKSVHFSFGERLKQFFLHPKHLEGRPEASTVSTELSIEPVLPERFHTISEATVALKNLTDRMVLHLDDTDTARAKLELLISHGVLRPFTDDLVNRVYTFLNGGISGTAAGIELSRYASEPAIQTARTVGECKRELIVERDSEIIQAFAVKSIKALLRQLLEMLLPLLKDVDTSGCQVLDTVTDIMAMEVASTISLDHLMRRADTDVSDTAEFSESSMDFMDFEAARSTATDDRTTISGGENGCP